ncbi:hypothetical protein E2C01_081319 [Portunus trituberculatus]|uniref:Uncharacterized protein n=1 Tax=Portunus trituberculatus TaxID=210409 RepID=A0A5B7IWB8_PORTR|nr:hypothetical protein [Portunus trituberculatus]
MSGPPAAAAELSCRFGFSLENPVVMRREGPHHALPGWVTQGQHTQGSSSTAWRGVAKHNGTRREPVEFE